MAPGSRQLANEAWEALLTAHTTLMKEFAAAGIWGELSMREYDVLYTLSKCPGPIRHSELNRHLLLSQPALSRMIDRLEERGLVERGPDPSDGRGSLLGLTNAGRTAQRRVGRRHGADVARAMTAHLDDDELHQLRRLCRKMIGEPAS